MSTKVAATCGILSTSVVLMLLAGLDKPDDPRPGAAGPAAIAVAPVLHLDAGSDLIELEFRNDSSQRFCYAAGPYLPVPGVYHLNVSLYKNGELIEPVQVEPSPLGATRCLEAGESVRHIFRLGSWYLRKQLSPGRYELRASYDIPEDSGLIKGYGLTPARFKETFLLEIED